MTETKLQISERLYEHLNLSHDPDYQVSDFHSSLWINPSFEKYFRLSSTGFNTFNAVGNEYFVIEISGFGHENLKRLKFYSDNLHVPYYLVPDNKIQAYNSLLIYDKKIATISKLYDSFEDYLIKASTKDK